MHTIIRFIAVVVAAPALVSRGAYVFALARKIGLAGDSCFIVQRSCRGLETVALVLAAAMVFDLMAAAAAYDHGVPPGLALAAELLVGAPAAVFPTWTYPAHVATANQTLAAGDRDRLRPWDYSHAVSALLAFIALSCTSARHSSSSCHRELKRHRVGRCSIDATAASACTETVDDDGPDQFSLDSVSDMLRAVSDSEASPPDPSRLRRNWHDSSGHLAAPRPQGRGIYLGCRGG